MSFVAVRSRHIAQASIQLADRQVAQLERCKSQTTGCDRPSIWIRYGSAPPPSSNVGSRRPAAPGLDHARPRWRHLDSSCRHRSSTRANPEVGREAESPIAPARSSVFGRGGSWPRRLVSKTASGVYKRAHACSREWPELRSFRRRCRRLRNGSARSNAKISERHRVDAKPDAGVACHPVGGDQELPPVGHARGVVRSARQFRKVRGEIDRR